MLGRTLLVTGISLRSDQKASDNTCDMFGVQVAKTAWCPYPKDSETYDCAA
jgi:hypothetical protein